tara:strand:- start:418 stop:1173 length:756 start_codon:yes stop_codon:yes gene_type:complete
MIKINGQTVFSSSPENEPQTVEANAKCVLETDTTTGGFFGIGGAPAPSASSIAKYVDCVNGRTNASSRAALRDFRSAVDGRMQTFYEDLGAKHDKQDFDTKINEMDKKIDEKHDKTDFDDAMEELDDDLQRMLDQKLGTDAEPTDEPTDALTCNTKDAFDETPCHCYLDSNTIGTKMRVCPHDDGCRIVDFQDWRFDDRLTIPAPSFQDCHRNFNAFLSNESYIAELTGWSRERGCHYMYQTRKSKENCIS